MVDNYLNKFRIQIKINITIEGFKNLLSLRARATHFAQKPALRSFFNQRSSSNAKASTTKL